MLQGHGSGGAQAGGMDGPGPPAFLGALANPPRKDPGTWHHLHRNVTPILSFERFRKSF